MSYVLAQVNIGRLRAPADSPALADFMTALDPVNAEAEDKVRFLRAHGPDAAGVHAPGALPAA